MFLTILGKWGYLSITLTGPAAYIYFAESPNSTNRNLSMQLTMVIGHTILQLDLMEVERTLQHIASTRFVLSSQQH